MKRTMKKHLSLLLAVLMLLTSVGFSAFATTGECTSHQTAGEDPAHKNVIYPTCTQEGYTEYKCVNCGEVVYTANRKEPLGHSFGDYEYVTYDNGESYNRIQKCTRKYVVNGSDVYCNATNIENDNGTPVVYYLVKFFNNWVTDKYISTITYTKVADTYKAPQELYSCYVKKGEAVEYKGKTPFREKTTEFSSYSWTGGWTTDKNLQPTYENNLTIANGVNISNITSKMELYPVFAGNVENHGVTFYGAENQKITNEQSVVHGGNAFYSSYYEPPVKKADFANFYKFAGWKSGDGKGAAIAANEIEQYPIYGDVHFYPTYDAVAKNFTVVFYGYDEENIIKYEEQLMVFDNVNLKDNLLAIEAVNRMSNDPDVVDKPDDDIYTYTFTGWRVLTGENKYGSDIKLNDFVINSGDCSYVYDEEGNAVTFDNEGFEEQKKVVCLVPVYSRKLRTYVVDIQIQAPYGEDKDYDLSNAVVQVVDKDNQFAASGKTNKDGKFRCYLNYRLPFTVTVATADEKYLGTQTITTLEKAPDGDLNFEALRNTCLVQLELNPEYESHCRCIHHNSLLQPIIVRIFNILYSLFNVKYVCCYDMYSTIGPLLDYMPD